MLVNIPFRYSSPKHTNLTIKEYGKNSLRKTADNLSDLSLALRNFR